MNRHAERGRAVEILDLARQHGLEDLACESIARGDSPGQFRERLAKRLLVRSMGGGFSFSRMLGGMAAGTLDGLEAEVLQETARAAGKAYDPQRVTIPFSAFTRDLSTATPGAGGYLAGTETGEAVDTLRPWSVVARAGVTVLERLRGDQSIPRTTGNVTVHWLDSETAEPTASQPALGSISMTPKTASAFTPFSRNFGVQANGETFVRRELLRTAGIAVDVASLNGSGVAGQPLGLLNHTGYHAQTGTSLAFTGVLAMKKNVAESNAADADIAYIATPAIRELLEGREKVADTAQFIWATDSVADRPAYVSTIVPTATMVAGVWSELVVGFWSGIEVELNPFDPDGFKAGTIQARVMVTMDTAVLHPAAFSVARAVT